MLEKWITLPEVGVSTEGLSQICQSEREQEQ